MKSVKTENSVEPVKPVLTVAGGAFRLYACDRETRESVNSNSYWRRASGEAFDTTDIGAAAKFREFATPKVEKIFRRTFQEFYGSVSISRRAPSVVSRLDGHQREGLRWVLSRKRSYLAHAPGAGKTVQAILAGCLAEGPGRVVFVVPPSLVANWEREIWKFTEWLDLFPTIGVVRTTDEADRVAWRAQFIIVPDSMLAASWVYARLQTMKIKLLAVDEASRFKESTATRTIALFGGVAGDTKYSGIFRDARHVVLLDGSPLLNRPIELWAPTFALDPESIDCKGYDDFGMRYCGPRPNERGQWEYRFSSHEEELQKKLRASFMHVVPESALNHPERRRSILVMSDDVRSLEHQRWEKKNLKSISQFESRVKDFSEEASMGEMARFRKELGIRKVPGIARYVRDRLDGSGESILLFAWHREVVKGLAVALKKYIPGVIMGGTKTAEREKEFTAFQAGASRLIIMNIAAGGRGHNLPRADRCIFGEYSWTDETNKQCEKRASRRGSERDYVRCEYMVVPNSMDELVLQSLFAKEKRVKKVIGE